MIDRTLHDAQYTTLPMLPSFIDKSEKCSILKLGEDFYILAV